MSSLSSTGQPQVSPASDPFIRRRNPQLLAVCVLWTQFLVRRRWREVINPKRLLGLRRDPGPRESKGRMAKQRHDVRVMEALADRVGRGIFAGESVRRCSVRDVLGWGKHPCPRCNGSK